VARSFGGALKLAKRAQWLSLFFEDQHRVQGGFIEFIDLFDFEMAGFDKRLEFKIGAPTEPARHRIESLGQRAENGHVGGEVIHDDDSAAGFSYPIGLGKGSGTTVTT
jgi:hypothetical protein